MKELLAQVLAAAYELIKREVPRLVPSFRWATVTSVDPLRIKFDDQTTPVAATPGNTAGPLAVNDRVDVRHRSGQTPIVTGRSGGPRVPWGGVTGKPSTFAPSAHAHSSITDGSATLQIGESGERLYSETKLVYDRTYTGVGIAGGTRLMCMTNAGTFGTFVNELPQGLLPFKIAAGSVDVTPTANSATSVTVTFPSGLFSGNPNIVATANSGVPGTRVQEVTYSNRSASSCQLVIYRTDTTKTTISWIAVV